jgi:hypothetical protein
MSITVKIRNGRPSLERSCMQSIAHPLFGVGGIERTARTSNALRRFVLRSFSVSASSRYSRYVSLWLIFQPSRPNSRCNVS